MICNRSCEIQKVHTYIPTHQTLASQMLLLFVPVFQTSYPEYLEGTAQNITQYPNNTSQPNWMTGEMNE